MKTQNKLTDDLIHIRAMGEAQNHLARVRFKKEAEEKRLAEMPSAQELIDKVISQVLL